MINFLDTFIMTIYNDDKSGYFTSLSVMYVFSVFINVLGNLEVYSYVLPKDCILEISS